MRFLLLPLVVALAACGGVRLPERPDRAIDTLGHLPPMKMFSGVAQQPSIRSNAELAQDFLDLSFRMESGRPLAVMSRFEEPVTLRVTGNAPPSLGPDLARLLQRLRREAGIDIRQVHDRSANITIEALPQARLQAAVPQAACFVVPRVKSWAEFRINRHGRTTDWTTLTRRETVSIFVPNDVSPQELRDCLHEELAQALGPLNDLYRLPDSVFNDDNFHTVLTGFDMLMLRLYYAPELNTGMTRQEAAAIVPRLLQQINPQGGTGVARRPISPRAWITAIETALGPSEDNNRRREAASRAVDIARARGWQDSRLGFALFVQGRLLAPVSPERAHEALSEAQMLFRARPETMLQASHVALHLAVFELSSGHPRETIALVDANLNDARTAENAALLATFLMIKAEALDLLGRTAEADAVRNDSLGWARYGFGNARVVFERLAEIASLVPQNRSFGG